MFDPILPGLAMTLYHVFDPILPGLAMTPYLVCDNTLLSLVTPCFLYLTRFVMTPYQCLYFHPGGHLQNQLLCDLGPCNLPKFDLNKGQNGFFISAHCLEVTNI